jgi:hypothetical protein
MALATYGVLKCRVLGRTIDTEWISIFLAFQSQCFHTDDRTGDAIPEVCSGDQKQVVVKILAALVNPLEADRGIKVHGVSYTEEQAQKRGWTLVFST